MTDFKDIQQTLVSLDGQRLQQLILKALDSGVTADDILNNGLIAGMDIIGEKMEKEEMFIPEVLMAAQTMAGGLEILKPLLGEENQSTRGTVVIGTVKGDLHDIGKNLVAMMMESAGLTVHNIGVDIPPEGFVAAVKEKKANILCLSALLTTTMPMMPETISAIEKAGLRQDVRIMVGGAPVTQAYAGEIGADAYAPDAGSAARRARNLII